MHPLKEWRDQDSEAVEGSMNVVDPARRLALLHFLLSGFSIREAASRAGTNKNTALSYMHRLGIKRPRGHRSPLTYRHANQCSEWWQRHESPPQIYDEAVALELQWIALGQMKARRDFKVPPLDADLLAWKQGKETLAEIRRALKERTNRQSQ